MNNKTKIESIQMPLIDSELAQEGADVLFRGTFEYKHPAL